MQLYPKHPLTCAAVYSSVAVPTDSLSIGIAGVVTVFVTVLGRTETSAVAPVVVGNAPDSEGKSHGGTVVEASLGHFTAKGGAYGQHLVNHYTVQQIIGIKIIIIYSRHELKTTLKICKKHIIKFNIAAIVI